MGVIKILYTNNIIKCCGALISTEGLLINLDLATSGALTIWQL